MAEWSLWDKAINNSILAFWDLKKKLCVDLEQNQQIIKKYACSGSAFYNSPFLLFTENRIIKAKLEYVEQILFLLVQARIKDGILPRYELEILEERLKPLISEGDIWILENFYWTENIIDPEDLNSDIFREWFRYIDRLVQKRLAAICIFPRIDIRQRFRKFIRCLFKKMDDNSCADALVLLFQQQSFIHLENYHSNEKGYRINKTYSLFT